MVKTPKKNSGPQIRKVVGLLTGRPLRDGRYSLQLECGHIIIAHKDAEQAVCEKCVG